MSISTDVLRPEQPEIQEATPPCPDCGGETFIFCDDALCENCIRFQLVRYGDEEV